MKMPIVRGVIDRRILVNFRVDPDVLSWVIPRPFVPQIVNGLGIAGICLIRLRQIRPLGFPSMIGLSSENVAHRVAVEWEFAGERKTGVFVFRRDTSSGINSLVGGRLFPGVHHLARFTSDEDNRRFQVDAKSIDSSVTVAVDGELSQEWTSTSAFSTLDAASHFFEKDCIGYSPQTMPGVFDGLELRTVGWQVEHLRMHCVKSSFFENTNLFPHGTIQLDCALLMRGIKHEWHKCDSLTDEDGP
ncbi:MAG: DUF2071 domain-containing protein [Planctomycetaceae bacterium]|nr:DUF2071 domain-containing protein [Planctomycetaceae bacterium]